MTVSPLLPCRQEQHSGKQRRNEREGFEISGQPRRTEPSHSSWFSDGGWWETTSILFKSLLMWFLLTGSEWKLSDFMINSLSSRRNVPPPATIFSFSILYSKIWKLCCFLKIFITLGKRQRCKNGRFSELQKTLKSPQKLIWVFSVYKWDWAKLLSSFSSSLLHVLWLRADHSILGLPSSPLFFFNLNLFI